MLYNSGSFLSLVLHNLAIVCLASLKRVVAIYTASCSWLTRTAANVDSTFVIIKDAFAKQVSEWLSREAVVESIKPPFAPINTLVSPSALSQLVTCRLWLTR